MSKSMFYSSVLPIEQLRRDRPQNDLWGGYCSFEGIIRRQNLDKRVVGIDYEVYHPLADTELMRVIDESRQRWDLGFAQVVHREGQVGAGEVAVFIQTMAPHRHPAIQGCEMIIDLLKHRVPIWKRELYDDGSYSWPICHHSLSSVKSEAPGNILSLSCDLNQP